MAQDYLTAREAAELLKLKKATVAGSLRASKVKTVKANVSEVLWEPSDREWYKVHTFCKDYQ